MELRPIPGYTLYMASDDGRIWSVRSNRFIKAYTRSDGYQTLTLCEDGQRRCKFVHRLVALAFHEQQPDKPIINHKDQNRSNNSADNLEWCDYQYNNNYGDCKARQVKTVGIERLRELQHAASMKRRHPVVNIDTGQRYDSIANACRATGARSGNIVAACMGRYKTCMGYRWRYEEEV